MLNSLLASLGSAGNGLLSLLGGQANAQPQQPQSPGFGDRFMAGIQGALNSGSPMGALGNLIGGFSTGARTDPAGVQGAAVQAQLRDLIARGAITPVQAQFLAANPKAWEELSKAMINQPLTSIGRTGIRQGPFGQYSVAVEVPESTPTEVVNQDGSKSPAFRVAPNLGNPSGRIAIPGQPQSPAPPSQASSAGPLLNPNLPNGGRPIITEASPQATKEREGVGASLAEDYKEINKKAAAATTRLGTLSRLAQLSPGAYEGAGAPALQLVRSFLTTLGIPSTAVPKGEEFVALSNKMVLDANNGSLGTGVSNADVAFIKNMQPDLAQTREGRMQIIETARQLAKRDQQVAKLAADYRREKGSLDGFQVYLADWAEKNPMFAGVRPPSATFGERFGAISDPRPGSPGIRIIGVR